MNISETEWGIGDLKNGFWTLMLLHWRIYFIHYQWYIVGPCQVGWRKWCVQWKPHIFWVTKVRYYPNVDGSGRKWSLFGHCFCLVFLPVGRCAISKRQLSSKPKGAICNQNKADKNWTALEVATYYGKTFRKLLVSYHQYTLIINTFVVIPKWIIGKARRNHT